VGKLFDSSAITSDRIYGRPGALPGPKNLRRLRDRVREPFRSAGIGLLLFSVVGAGIAGAQTVFLLTILAAWSLFPVLVGLKNTLDAGLTFMLISLGVLVVVGVAQNGVGYLLP
jgi:hypothetical protein